MIRASSAMAAAKISMATRRSPPSAQRAHRSGSRVRWRRPSSLPMAEMSRWHRPCFTAPAWLVRLAARCRPGCAFRKAGASWRRMSASLTSHACEGAPATEARNIPRAGNTLRLDQEAFDGTPVGQRDRADRERRRYRGNEAAEAFGRERPDLDLDRGALPVRHAHESGLRRLCAGQCIEPIVAAGLRGFEQPTAKHAELAIERHA